MAFQYPYPPQPWPPRKKPRVWPWIVIPVAVLTFGGCAAIIGTAANEASKTAPSTTVPRAIVEPVIARSTASTTTPATTTPAGPATTIRKDGTYMVGTQIEPGTWQATGGSFCYWERMKDLTGGFGSILDNGLESGQQLVTILPTDKAFKTQGCGTWTLIPN